MFLQEHSCPYMANPVRICPPKADFVLCCSEKTVAEIRERVLSDVKALIDLYSLRYRSYLSGIKAAQKPL